MCFDIPNLAPRENVDEPTVKRMMRNLNDLEKELMKLAMPGFRDFAANPPRLPGYSRVAGFDPLQTLGQEQALTAAGAQGGIAGGAAGAHRFLTDPGVVDPNSNPALRGAIEAATRPIQENLVTSTLPAIRSEFVGAGQYGGSRQGIAEGLASRSASQAIGDASSRVANEGYLAGLDAMTKGLGLTPTAQSSQLAPALTTSGVGDVRQAFGQEQLTERASDFNYEQLAPFLVSSDLASIVAGMPGGSQTVSATAPRQSPLSSILGILSLIGGLGGGGGLFGAAG